MPFSSWHVKARLLVGTATFFDACDSLAIAYVLPVLIPLWHIQPALVGGLISIAYVGQIIGALLFGWLAERIGRLHAVWWTILIFSIMSIASAFSWDYNSLFAFRLIEGVGLGGEVPIAAAYISEISKAKGRGKFVLLYESLFGVGLVAAAALGYWVVPNFGWQYMFLIGGLPALLVIFLRRLLPESPRWLIDKGRLDEAEKIVEKIETIVSKQGRVKLPPVQVSEMKLEKQVTQWRELFSGIYHKRTLVLWVLWFTAYFLTYGLQTWLPALYTSVYKLPLQQALLYPVITNILGLVALLVCSYLIDWSGRKPWFTISYVGAGLAMLFLWLSGARDVFVVFTCATLSFLFITTISLALYVYSPEIYPTRMRALGSSAGTIWLRVASAIGPLAWGMIVAGFSLPVAFLIFGIVALVGCVVAGLGTTETKGKLLEQISP